jgi:nucleoside-diphosphate-sugar epimerase
MTDSTASATPNAPQNVFITHADSAAGRAIVKAWVQQGARVVGSTRHGAAGAAVIRRLGAVPAHTDLTREGDIRGMLKMIKADLVIDLSSMQVNQLPFQPLHADTAALDVVPLLNAAYAAGVERLIYVSFLGALPSAAHADHADDHHHAPHIVDESAELSRDHEAFRALARAESVLLKSDRNVTILRAGYVYSESDPTLEALVRALKAGRPLPNAPAHASFVHAADLAAAVVLAVQAEALPSRVYHIADDHSLSLNDFAAQLGAALGVGAPLRLPLLNVLVGGLQAVLLNHSVHITNTRAKAELGWQPRFPTVAAGFEQILLEWRAAEALALLPASTSQSTALAKA